MKRLLRFSERHLLKYKDVKFYNMTMFYNQAYYKTEDILDFENMANHYPEDELWYEFVGKDFISSYFKR